MISETFEKLLEKREVEYFTGLEKPKTAKATFPFLVVDAPEKWPEAKEFTYEYNMPMLGTQDRLRFPLTGVSLAEWSEVDASVVVPEWDGEVGKESDEFLTVKNQAVAHKEVILLEKSLGKPIPGKSSEEKRAFLAQRNPGEIDALMLYIRDCACGWSDVDPQLVAEYQELLRKGTLQPEAKQFTSFDDWKVATECTYCFRRQRMGDKYILEFPLKGITRADKERIEIETKEPPAPKVPSRDAEGKMDRNAPTKEDRTDPSWLKMARAVYEKETVLLLQATLTFTIPGDNEKEQYDWISKRLVGDVMQLKKYIQTDLLTFTSRYNFFTIGQDQAA